MNGNLPAKHSKRVDEFLAKMTTARGRLIFALDATASRQPTWDQACQLQSEMFTEAGKIGGLEIQLAYYRGDEFEHFSWTTDASELANKMRQIRCKGGETQIARVLQHIRKEHTQNPVTAAVFVGDAMEGDEPGALRDAAAGLGVPLFVFQEGDDPEVEKVFGEMACLTKPRGAYSKFAPGVARALGELLRAVAAFAAGGLKALANQNTDGARRLLQQLKKQDEKK